MFHFMYSVCKAPTAAVCTLQSSSAPQTSLNLTLFTTSNCLQHPAGAKKHLWRLYMVQLAAKWTRWCSMLRGQNTAGLLVLFWMKTAACCGWKQLVRWEWTTAAKVQVKNPGHAVRELKRWWSASSEPVVKIRVSLNIWRAPQTSVWLCLTFCWYILYNKAAARGLQRANVFCPTYTVTRAWCFRRV